MDSPQLKTIFGEALVRRDGPERAAYLDEACRGDTGLRARVETLLNDHERIGRFLGTATGSIPSAGQGPEELGVGDITRAETPDTCGPAGPRPGEEQGQGQPGDHRRPPAPRVMPLDLREEREPHGGAPDREQT